ncbi:OmpA family protein [Shewanella atlantica]|uniref:OmpA family protein n=1 Tax=Shewanella atlantica TaxID=271099 RepID=A0A3S0L3E5_9GAMM|nr:OmpA family protein [Shewanella atlantica]RTR26071.1 OmpA family protein [Shewanella atlantica]
MVRFALFLTGCDLSFWTGSKSRAIVPPAVTATAISPVVTPITMPTPAPVPVSFNGSTRFSVDSSVVDVTDELALLLEKSQQHSIIDITVIGHTDDAGSAVYSQDLSEKRARAVADYFVRQGIDEQRLIVKGKGEGSPVSGNETEDGRSKNRRVGVLLRGMSDSEINR